MKCGCLIGTTSYFPSHTQERLSHRKTLNENFKKQESNFERRKQTSYTNSSHVVHAFEVLDTLRKGEVLCDIKLETEDGTLVYGHKVVLASATPYFQTMFTNFEESQKKHVILRELNSTALKLIVDFIYTGQIMITEDNVKALLSAANLLQLHDVKEACCDFLQTQLNPKNCLGFKALISLYDCVEYLTSFKSYILQNFSEMIEGDEFLNLFYDELVEIISCTELNSSSEEKVFECVVNWVNHDLSNRKDVFPELMEHVRLPLTSKEYLYNRVRGEPLLKSNIKCRDYLEDAIFFHLLNSEKPDIIRTEPRQPVKSSLPKVILIVGKERNNEVNVIQWFDPATNNWQLCPELTIPLLRTNVTVSSDRLLIFLENSYDGKFYTFDLFSPSPCFRESMPMLQKRIDSGVCVLDDCVYAIGGYDDSYRTLKSAEAFNFNSQNQQMISDMSSTRMGCGVGVLDNHIYAVGGSGHGNLKSVERYCPRTDTWEPVANMNERRFNAGIAVLNDVLYAVGGYDGRGILKSVEAYTPSSNTWTFVSDMHRFRCHARVVALNGLLYVVGNEYENNNDCSAEFYDPESNTWTMLSGTMNIYDFCSGAVVIDKPPQFIS